VGGLKIWPLLPKSNTCFTFTFTFYHDYDSLYFLPTAAIGTGNKKAKCMAKGKIF